MADIPFHPRPLQDMARDKERPYLEVVLDNPYIVLNGTGPDVDPTTLSGHVTLFLTESTSIKEITLQFKGKAKIPIQTSDSIITGGTSLSHVICSHDWSFLEGDKKHAHTLGAGYHKFPFHLQIDGSFPSSLFTQAMGSASVAYKLRAVAARPGFSYNLQTVVPVYILRSLAHEALEYHQTLDIENTWPDKLMYSITIPHKAWAAGDTLIAIVKLSPLLKGVSVRSIVSSLTETTKISARGSSHENTRVISTVKHEIADRKAVEVDPHSSSSSAVAGSSGAWVSAAAHFAHSAPNSRPPSPPHPGPSSSHLHYTPPARRQEEEDLEFDSNDVVTYLNLPIPPSSAYPFSFSASPPPSPHVISSSHSQPSTPSGTLFSFTNTTSPAITPPRSASPTHQYAPSSANSGASHPTRPFVPTVTPSHSLEPIVISHRIKWNIFILNKDGHVSELKCSLPIKILDGALLNESRGITMRSRRLLLRTSGLGGVLSRGGEDGSDADDDRTGEDDEAAERDEEGRIRSMEADRELPSYPAHVRDRVANMYLPEAVTMRVSNPWVGRVGPTSTASGTGSLSNPELSGPGESDITNPLITAVSSLDPSAATDRSPVPHTQPHSQSSRSGRSTPAIQQLHVMSHLPHVPGSGENTPLDWVNSELLLSLSLDGEALRRIGGVPSQQQQSQPQPHQNQHQHQTHSHNQQQNRTLRWGSRAGSRAGSPDRNTPSSTTNNNSIVEGINGGAYSSPGSITSPAFPSSSSSGSGFASPFQNLFKATMKPFSALTGHHHAHGHRPTQPRSRSTTSLMGLLTATSDLNSSANGNGRPLALNPHPSQIYVPSSGLSLTCPSPGAGLTVSSTPSTPQAGMNAFISTYTSYSSQSLATNTTLSSSPLSDPVLESTSAGYPFPTTSTPASTSASLALLHNHQPPTQDPSSQIYRAFTIVPDYSIASRGFIGGVPPLSSMRGLPSYEEAEAQRKERDAQVLRERGTMSESDLVGRFANNNRVRFETRMHAGTVTETEGETAGGGVGIVQQLEDGEDEDEDDAGGTGAIQMRTRKANP